jgi:hypothetical protein
VQLLTQDGSNKALKLLEELNFISCVYCEGKFASTQGLGMHVIKRHQEINTFQCTLCSLFFLNKALLIEHKEQAHHDEVTHNCIYCSEGIFRNIERLRVHVKTEHRDVFVQCKWLGRCTKYFLTQEEKDEHVRNIHINRVYRCIYCSITYANKESVSRHVQRKHQNSLIQCNYNLGCGEFFHSHEEKDKHIKQVHENAENKMCPICQKILKGKLAVHLQGHHKDILIFSCSYAKCRGVYLSKEKLQVHVERMHEMTNSHTRCKFCSKAIFKGSLHEHFRPLHNLFTCTFKKCAQLFSTATERRKHAEKDHSRIMKSSCIYCNKVFSCNALMSCHVKYNHSDVKIKCSIRDCSSYFLSQSDCDTHFKDQHQEEHEQKTYKCDKCSYSFIDKRGLEAHFGRFHSYYQIKCLKCTKVFSSNQSMLYHLLHTHSEGKTCQHCNLKFKGLKKHQRRNECTKCQNISLCTRSGRQHEKKCTSNKQLSERRS